MPGKDEQKNKSQLFLKEGSMKNTFEHTAIDEIINEFGRDPSWVMAILQGIQEKYRYLPKEFFPYISKRLRVSEASIYSVATFYENFSLEAKGKYIIKVCDGTACHVRRSIPILERLRTDLNLSEKEKTTKDLNFTVETVSCLGACGLAPVVTVNDTLYKHVKVEDVKGILANLKEVSNGNN